MEVAKVSRSLLDHCKADPDLRLKETAFTRQRKLGPQRLLLILLHRLAACLQLAIDTYFKSVEEDPVSKQAFSKARAGLNPEFVRCLTPRSRASRWAGCNDGIKAEPSGRNRSQKAQALYS